MMAPVFIICDRALVAWEGLVVARGAPQETGAWVMAVMEPSLMLSIYSFIAPSCCLMAVRH